MPLTKLQSDIARLLAANRSEDSYLAGGSALNFTPNSKRYSNDLDYFHDSIERVASAFLGDRTALLSEGYAVEIQMNQPGFIRAIVSKDDQSTKIEWAHDSAWRFMPVVRNAETGTQLHPIDLAVNKLLALAGRDEPRDFLDILYIHEYVLPLGALIWAAVGKDPGFTPLSLLDIIRRRGKYRPEDFARLDLVEKVDLIAIKTLWIAAIEDAENFIHSRGSSEIGVLYFSISQAKFIMPTLTDQVILHYGRPGGILPKFLA
jgi:hypothetical protein